MRKILLIVSVLTALGIQVLGQDWPQWRGPNRDGVASGFKAPGELPGQLTQRWKVDVGLGYATPVLVGNRIYVFTRQKDNEVMMALDSGSGKTLWQTDYPAPFKVNPVAAAHGAGPKSTPAFFNGKLYTLGMSGIVSAFDAASGKLLWQKPAPPVQPLYHTAMSPIVDRGLVIIHVGGHGDGALAAFEENTGNMKWTWNGDGPGYGSPIIAEFEGTRQVVTFTQDNLIGVSAATGELLWRRAYTTNFTQNIITPILYGQTLIVSGYEKPVAAFRVLRKDNQWATQDVWENPAVSLYMSDAVIVQDMVFGMSHRNSGQYFSLDAKTGKTLWLSEPRRATNAAIVRAGNLLFVLEDDADVHVIRPGATAYETLRSYDVATDSRTWAQPVLSGDRIFVKDESSLRLWTWN
jgi:outer membrane protein assembly factor BamB